MKKKISPKNKNYYENILPLIDNLKKNDLINSYLGNKGYSIYKVSLNDKIIQFIKKELTVKPFVQSTLVEPTSFPVYMESDKKIYVPRFWGINIFGNPKSIKINFGKSIDLKFNGELRDYQTIVMNAYLKAINFKRNENEYDGNGSALIELWTGAGKTVLALKIIEQLKKKTIIFVHKTFLKNQWIERIQQFLPDARVGKIQGPTIDIEDKDIVIGMLQSLSIKDYDINLVDLMTFLPLPAEDFSNTNIQIHYLGYYLKWVPQEAYYYAVEKMNFKARPFRTQGTYSKYNSIDDKIDDLHYYTTFIKFGIGRATYDVSQELRNDHLSLEEGKKLIKKYDGEFPDKYFSEIMKYLNIKNDNFYQLCDNFRSPHLWKKVKKKWLLRHTANKDGVND